MMVWIKQILKNFWTSFQNFIYFLITLFLSFVLVLWPLYRYLFKKAVVHKLPLDLLATHSYILIGIYVLNLITWCVLLGIAIRHFLIFQKIIKVNSNTLFYRFSKTLNEFYNARVSSLYQFLVDIFCLEYWLFRPILEPLTRGLTRYLYNKPLLDYGVIFMVLIPNVIFITVLFWDFVIFKELRYIFKVTPILLIPLIDRFLRFWFHQYSNKYRRHCSDALIFIYNNQYYFADEVINAQIDLDIMTCVSNRNHRITFNIPLPLPYYKTMIGLISPTYFEKKIYIYNLNEHSSFKEIAAVFSEKCIPISVFGIFYTSAYKYMFVFFGITRAFCYVCIWFCVIAISL